MCLLLLQQSSANGVVITAPATKGKKLILGGSAAADGVVMLRVQSVITSWSLLFGMLAERPFSCLSLDHNAFFHMGGSNKIIE